MILGFESWSKSLAEHGVVQDCDLIIEGFFAVNKTLDCISAIVEHESWSCEQTLRTVAEMRILT
jgi:hypothetical protein